MNALWCVVKVVPCLFLMSYKTMYTALLKLRVVKSN